MGSTHTFFALVCSLHKDLSLLTAVPPLSLHVLMSGKHLVYIIASPCLHTQQYQNGQPMSRVESLPEPADHEQLRFDGGPGRSVDDGWDTTNLSFQSVAWFIHPHVRRRKHRFSLRGSEWLGEEKNGGACGNPNRWERGRTPYCCSSFVPMSEYGEGVDRELVSCLGFGRSL